jgi:hypothetical protein
MNGAPLRPVPSRPSGPVEPDEALRHLRTRLPALDERATKALALVALAGRSRADAATEAKLGAEELADALARGRKALRRSLHPLPGSGWCERAERLISDRLDGALESPGSARLEVHLLNCPRCVEHERRLAQATDLLVASFVGEREGGAGKPAQEKTASAPDSGARSPDLKVVAAGQAADSSSDRPTRRTPGAVLATLAWSGLIALAVLLAVAGAVLVVVVALGAEL